MISPAIFDGLEYRNNTAFIDYLPSADGPLPTDQMSFGSLKAV